MNPSHTNPTLLRIVVPVAAALCLTACGSKEAPQSESASATSPSPTSASQAPTSVGEPVPDDAAIPADTIATAFGKGSLERDDGELASFTVDVNFRPGNVVGGTITYSSFFEDGKLDLVASVNCGRYDTDTKRVWIGGEISQNKSTRDDLKTGGYDVGQPVWFRFEESDTHPEPAAQVSDLGFAGNGYATAADFCADTSWSSDGLRDLSAQGAVIIFALPEGMTGG
ncbi:MAG: hypothetical protein AAF610_07540 [Pseudomonadota bacterium]